ncbi:isoleucine--tRNA ligase [Clostridium pasteurianum DSM 525 = ATCC 6013]|uniref:Isoleucine--tRNA ligase n=1 Tax=Clostridium pasteurianum DSM 525 = ATCC 6013 TaxID=1262449 RepID=A0A0H3J301_CLOPA|nr:isoleucine--tRNA ligase [Clostridium pasteurianum]AJA46293.1 isoleucine--tRNA ligase [Clostridium pasteurianum DSM 525 = ATCC 6013]AJA50281.1 isoleucine--tRNA ligase [Clostridium pasteurianum DSM 525 = ATCC 6013]AOZ73744.1 isoleucine--tRNA ligase [Clostridium pasteurianum DSM 525 = ATCC 6013]AOZ77541.1 isoleucine--tRNA ligase [Clostridium pasteurianum]ELP60877.1 isoleucyl-tRNA ligase [Clostridium pasteurianum DSM 525 = ATCC 6013]
MYKKVDGSKSFVDMEKDVLKLWHGKAVIKKSFESNQDGEYFTFYDGPPTANGKPHVGHVITRVMKDIIPRYKVMKGYKVLRKAGWDTHGLPVELEIEKKLGISGKPQIEEYGVEKFVKECKDSVFSYVSLWKDMSEKLGFWVDMDNPYVTYHNDYIESVWWALKTMWDKGLLYKGHKIVPYCPRCGTALSSHEVAQGYKDVKEATAFVKFKVKNEDKYILAWTTTPWTLPSNVALAINRAYTYVEVINNDEHLILAKDLLKVLEGEYEIVREFKGEELLGTEYEQLFKFETPKEKAFYVVHGDFVTLSDGTGIVHIAPAYGEDDNLLGKKYGLPLINLVDLEGKFVDAVEPWKGLFVKKADPKILEYMKEKGTLYKSEKFTHSYPHCWRCDTPLLYYPKDSWFVKMTSLRDKLLENNNKINWYPDNIRTGRFGKFLENVIDWGISRDRYWGTPLPIWDCECGHRECIGSIEELKAKGINVPENIELHKPYIDEVKLTCSVCGKPMTRTQEVIDCWFDSGSMPFAQHHYPFENKKLFEDNFPAQFISEAVDQTRGWFYTLLAISTAIFDTNSFENCVVLGHVLDKHGLKMSKHKGNVVDPFEVLEHQGADAARWHFYTSSAPWLPTRFSEEDVAETQRKFLSTLWNVYSFYVLYAEIDQFNPLEYKDFVSENVMDKWIVSKLNTLIKEVDEDLNTYKITQGALAIENFVDELSNWYVRRNRSRYWTTELTEDKIGAYTTLYNVLVNLSKVAAPFIPFMTEQIYQSLVVALDPKAKESVHLCNWPEYNEKFVDKDLENDMDLAYKLVKLGRSARNGANIKNRQPLGEMLLSTKAIPAYYGDIIKDELNIKEIVFGADLSKYVNFEIKPNLPVLGKAYGKLIPGIRKAIAERDQMSLAKAVNSGETVKIEVQGTEIELNSSNLLVTMQGLEGFAFAGEGELGVVLETTITPELQEEGYVREILSKIQNMRKESGFEVADKIVIYADKNDKLEAVIKKYEDSIKKETLANNIIYNSEREYSEYNINGEVLNLSVEKSI